MSTITHLTIEADDTAAAEQFYATLALGDRIRVTKAESPTSGFRGFTVSLIASQPANVNALFDAAVGAGATVVIPVTKSMWGYGGTFTAPDGTIVNVATSAKKDTSPAATTIDEVVLLLAADDVSTSKKFYVDKGFKTGKSIGGYVEFDIPTSPIGFGLLKRRALAKNAGVAPDGTGSHRLVIGGDLGSFTDPDGFEWR